mmetsp:Transcript_44668/g.120339  ORF Transcript_44668/g.120339 Transcript_44668/m.120339 type:complete len:233 (+) Transcript_44668:290-988(+)
MLQRGGREERAHQNGEGEQHDEDEEEEEEEEEEVGGLRGGSGAVRQRPKRAQTRTKLRPQLVPSLVNLNSNLSPATVLSSRTSPSSFLPLRSCTKDPPDAPAGVQVAMTDQTFFCPSTFSYSSPRGISSVRRPIIVLLRKMTLSPDSLNSQSGHLAAPAVLRSKKDRFCAFRKSSRPHVSTHFHLPRSGAQGVPAAVGVLVGTSAGAGTSAPPSFSPSCSSADGGSPWALQP